MRRYVLSGHQPGGDGTHDPGFRATALPTEARPFRGGS